ncbi:MAG TPA: DnaB-like helicase N-terminal domain-containing protein, partial [Ktedonobacterales bacterium]|nr:DnaB-like helicase N-terminal domain-containing protein [Ktedonobacterales bacterium]
MVHKSSFAIRHFFGYSGRCDLSATVTFADDGMLFRCYTLLKECSSQRPQPGRQHCPASLGFIPIHSSGTSKTVLFFRASASESLVTGGSSMAVEKLLPQNIEAEAGVLGSLLIDPGAIVQVADFLRADDFYREAHREIYRAALDLYE